MDKRMRSVFGAGHAKELFSNIIFCILLCTEMNFRLFKSVWKYEMNVNM